MEQREHEEIVRQIEEISFALEAGNRFFLSGALLLSYGFVILLIPLMELTTNYLTFNMYVRQEKPLLFAASQAITLFILFWISRTVVNRVWKEDHIVTIHPVLKESMTFYRPLTVALVGTIVVFIPMGFENILYPVIFMYFGIVFSILGRFAGKRITAVAWSYIVIGLGFALVSPRIQPTLWMYFNTYLGLSFLYLGFGQMKQKRTS